MAVYTFDLQQFMQFDDTTDSETLISLTFYGTLEDADVYFDNRLRSQAWKRATYQNRRAALFEASESIDRLDYKGTPTFPQQRQAFPRNGDTEAPYDVVKACYEIALKLLEGFDPEQEVRNLAAQSQGFSTVRNTYDRTFVLDHLRAGIISSKAWDWLKKYLNDDRAIKLCRVD